MRLITILLISISFNSNAASNQIIKKQTKEISFNYFINVVLKNNLDHIIQQYEISAAEALMMASKVYQDPELEMIFPMLNREDMSGFPRNIAFEMEVPVELFGKRRNRIGMAEAGVKAARANLEDFLRHLRAEAAMVYSEALIKQMVIERMTQTLEQLNHLVEINQKMYLAGEIGEVDVLKTRLEARNYESELFGVRTEFAALLRDIYYLMGGIPVDSLIFTGNPEKDLAIPQFDELWTNALENRPDLIAARYELNRAGYALQLARSERLPDVSLIAGYHNENATRPTPGIRATYAGLVIPLKFSGINKGAYLESKSRLAQTETSLQAIILAAKSELRSAWDVYHLQKQKRMLFSETILRDAERVRDAVVYSYRSGEVSLLEVLEAQRTMNDVYMNYYETLLNHAQSLIGLSKSAGVWLAEF